MQKIVYFDVDDTLVCSIGKKRIIMPAVVAEVRRLKDEGAILYLWSSGGAAYCRETAIEFGIHECFTGFLPKPTVYVDD
jgi:FMN phosphatase YigB (HAD superfamily)